MENKAEIIDLKSFFFSNTGIQCYTFSSKYCFNRIPYTFGKSYYPFHSIQNTFKFPFRFLLLPMDCLELCYFVFEHLRFFQIFMLLISNFTVAREHTLFFFCIYFFFFFWDHTLYDSDPTNTCFLAHNIISLVYYENVPDNKSIQLLWDGELYKCPPGHIGWYDCAGLLHPYLLFNLLVPWMIPRGYYNLWL